MLGDIENFISNEPEMFCKHPKIYEAILYASRQSIKTPKFEVLIACTNLHDPKISLVTIWEQPLNAKIANFLIIVKLAIFVCLELVAVVSRKF